MKEQKGITLIALIITIIVMLILVAVTINVALNGGIFTKAKDAALKTEIAEIQEQLLIAKAEKIAENNGAEPDDYELTLSSLNIPDSLKTKYQNKLGISADGKLYYTSGTEEEIVYFIAAGISQKLLTPDSSELEEPIELGYQYYTVSFKDLSNVTFDDYFTPIENTEMIGDDMSFAVFADENMEKMYSVGVYWNVSMNYPMLQYANITADYHYYWGYDWVHQNSEAPAWHPPVEEGQEGLMNYSITSSVPTFSGDLKILTTSEIQTLFAQYAPQHFLTQTQIEAILNLEEL